MTPRCYRTKLVEVEAIQVSLAAWQEICDFIYQGHRSDPIPDHPGQPVAVVGPPTNDFAMIIHTLEGDMRATPGDWIIRGAKGELYPCRSDIFAATYEPMETA